MAKWRHRYARINGLHTHYVEQGQGPLVVLAHGFPHTWV
jgi:pimeloyl-ACP methyl ester carboxylesterase